MTMIFHKIHVGSGKRIHCNVPLNKKEGLDITISIIQLIRCLWNHNHHNSFQIITFFSFLGLVGGGFLPRLSSDGVRLSTQSTEAAVPWWNDPNPCSLSNIELKTKATWHPDMFRIFVCSLSPLIEEEMPFFTSLNFWDLFNFVVN